MLTIEQCDDDNQMMELQYLTSLSLSNLSKYYESEIFEYYTNQNFTFGSMINNPKNYQNTAFEQKIYVKVNTPSNCFDYTSILLKVNFNKIEDDIFMNYETCESIKKLGGKDSKNGINPFLIL